jgi:vacuolar-type H+-ATPase subunit E/Vma4
MWSNLVSIGNATREFILWVAGLLVEKYTPGLVALALFIGLVLAILLYWRQVNTQIKTLRWLRSIINGHETPNSFTAAIVDIDMAIKEKSKDKSYASVVAAWTEYRETLVLYGEGDARHLRNSVRPSTFMNLEDLEYGAGFWRIMPGLFVTIGLFLTFLGLVAALSVMNVKSADPATLQASLDNLLTTASAKFIMSLTGLACSIVFTVVLRFGLGRLEHDIHALCSRIEYLLKFISLEDIAVEQLQAIKEQREHFRTIGMSLVAELGQSLREELPQTISRSIAESIGPMMDRVAKVGTEGVGGMINDLSEKFSSDVSGALANASDSIELAGRKIGELAARMDQSSGNMNEQLMASIATLTTTLGDIRKDTEVSAARTGEVFREGAEKMLAVMSETLKEIRENTGQGAESIKDAAAQMRSAAETFKEELSSAAQKSARQVEGQMAKTADAASGAITEAGHKMLGSFGETAQRIAMMSTDMGDRLSGGLLRPLDDISEKLSAFNRELANGTSEFSRLAEGVKTGADATVVAAQTFRLASQDMTIAADPIRSSVERIDVAVSKLQSTTTQTADIMFKGVQNTVQSAEAALKSASDILIGKQRAIEAALEGVKEIVDRMKGQGDKLDDLDAKLGEAFEKYAKHVSSALDMMVGHAREMQVQLSPAIDQMREVVEQAERFIPQSRVIR